MISMLRRVIKAKTITKTVALLIAVTPLFVIGTANSAVLTSRSVTVGNTQPSAPTTHLIGFTIPGVAPVGSIKLEYCLNSPFVGDSCTLPAGLDLSGVALSGQTGETGFSIHASSNVNTVVLTRPPVATSAIPVTYTLSNAVNPNSASQTVYVRISTYSTDDASGPMVDEGAVLFATADTVSVSGYVPPYLTFCVGVSVAVDCSSASGVLLNFGEFLTNTTKYLSSEYSGATNDPGGFSTSVAGVSMTSGNNIIPPLGSPQTSQPGVSQFGMNLRANSLPSIGADPAGPGTSAPVPQLNNPNQYFFNNQVVSNSPIPTDFRKFTASYVVNVSASQSPGIYSTTLTYIAVAAF